MSVPVGRAMLASQAAQQNRTKISQFPNKMGPHGMLMVFNTYRFRIPTLNPLLDFRTTTGNIVQESNGAVLLPIPNSLLDSTNLEIATFNLADSVGGETISSLFSGQGIPDTFNMFTPITGQDILSILKRLQVGGNFLWTDSIAQGIGISENPKASLIFRGVDLKNYSFEWMLAPKEPSESDSIRDIINIVKANSLPNFNRETLLTSVMQRYPSTVDIYLLGVDPYHFIRFKTAMVQNISVNFTPNGTPSILRGGKPSSVNLSISIKEMDIHKAQDYIPEFGGGVSEEDVRMAQQIQTEIENAGFGPGL